MRKWNVNKCEIFFLSGYHFLSGKNDVIEFFNSKSRIFYEKGIKNLPKRWLKIIFNEYLFVEFNFNIYKNIKKIVLFKNT